MADFGRRWVAEGVQDGGGDAWPGVRRALAHTWWGHRLMLARSGADERHADRGCGQLRQDEHRSRHVALPGPMGARWTGGSRGQAKAPGPVACIGSLTITPVSAVS